MRLRLWVKVALLLLLGWGAVWGALYADRGTDTLLLIGGACLLLSIAYVGK